MGSILFDGVVLGKDCIVGGGTVLLEGTIIDAGKIISGSPGMVRGEVTEARKERKRQGTRLYQSLPARYRNTMKEIPLMDVLL